MIGSLLAHLGEGWSLFGRNVTVAQVSNLAALPGAKIESWATTESAINYDQPSFSGGAFMEKEKMQRLEKKGWKIGTVTEFLELTPEEEAYIELKLALSDRINSTMLHFPVA